MPQLDLYNFFSIIFYSIIGILILFIFFQKHWLYFWKLLTLISTFLIQFKNVNIYYFISVFFNNIQQIVFILHSEVEKKKKSLSDPHILLFWGFLVIAIIVHIYFGHSSGGDGSGGGPGSLSATTANASSLPPPPLSDVLEHRPDVAKPTPQVVLVSAIPDFVHQLYQQSQTQIIQQINRALDNANISDEYNRQLLQNSILKTISTEIETGFIDAVTGLISNNTQAILLENDLQATFHEFLGDLVPTVIDLTISAYTQ